MLKTFVLTAALALVATGASAQKIDANGRCHDKAGKFAKMEVCKGAGAAASGPAAAATPPGGPFKLDAKGKCRNAKGQMAKKDLCKA